MSLTLLLIIATVLVSYPALQNPERRYRLIFYPYKMKREREFFRFITAGFVHADMQHLAFNMITLYFFGRINEQLLGQFALFGGQMAFVLLYFGGMVGASLYSYFKNQDNPNYMALGASGAVSAVVFSTILLYPWAMIYGIIPGFVYGIGYLIYSARMSKIGQDNIGHDAHFYGSIFGLLITIAFNPVDVIDNFLFRITQLPW